MDYDPYRIAQDFPIFNPDEGTLPLHYLDNAATTQVPKAVLDAMTRHDIRHRSNVKRGIHRLAEAATEAYENARKRIAAYLNACSPDEVVFTTGTTGGINMLALALGRSMSSGDEILLTQAEHHSNLIPWQLLSQEKGVKLRFLPVGEDGTVHQDAMSTLFTSRTRVVSVGHGSNVTGAMLDLPHLAGICKKNGALLIVDGAQAASQGPLDLPGLGPDFYVFSGHKVYGPTGIGVIWGKAEHWRTLPPVLGGGEMVEEAGLSSSTYAAPPLRFEPGTPPITQAIGLAAALDWRCKWNNATYHRHCAEMALRIINGLIGLGNNHQIRILGPPPHKRRLPLISFSHKTIHPHDICQLLNDRHHVALRGGHHCAQPLHQILGLPEGTTRASLACYNTKEDVDALLNGVEDCLKILG